MPISTFKSGRHPATDDRTCFWETRQQTENNPSIPNVYLFQGESTFTFFETAMRFVLTFLAVSLSLIGSPSWGAERSRPNVILIMADDFGYECVGADGGTSYPTPNLDRLAATGTRFEHCYVQPLCTPTRVQLMTGLYNVRNYVRFGLLDKDQTTFAHVLKQAGYATCITGKWQLGQDFSLPAHFGFDEYCLWQLTRRPSRYGSPGLEINGKEVDYGEDVYGPDVVNDYALEFIARKRDRPFFLYYPMMLTHDPYQATPDSTDYGGKKKELKKSGKLIDKRPDGTNQHFADMVTYMDKLIGQLVSQLDETGQRDNTLILFTGDNGTGAGTISYMGDRKVVGGKGKTIETGMHVPLIANWPSVVSSGQVSQDLVDSTDFLPTLCEATGTAIPANLELDGRSFYPQLRGEPGKPRDWIYCWYGKGAKSEFARNHRYKLYRGGDFFDVSNGDADDRPLDVNLLSDEAVAARRLLQSALDQFTDARPAQFAAPAKATKGDKAKPKKSQSKS